MFAVFWTIKEDNGNTVDHYETHEDRGQADAHYKMLLNNPKLYAAGISTINQATEPQWIEEGAETTAKNDLVRGLYDMILGERLTEADCPEDFQWLSIRLDEARGFI